MASAYGLRSPSRRSPDFELRRQSVRTVIGWLAMACKMEEPVPRTVQYNKAKQSTVRRTSFHSGDQENVPCQDGALTPQPEESRMRGGLCRNTS